MLVVVHDDTYVGALIAFLRIEIADAHAIFRDMETGEHDHIHIHLCNILFALQVVDAPFPDRLDVVPEKVPALQRTFSETAGARLMKKNSREEARPWLFQKNALESSRERKKIKADAAPPARP